MSESKDRLSPLEIIRKYNFPIRKRYGQNFLIDANIVQKIVKESGVTREDTVLEIGPGLGSLTEYLCEEAGEVIAIELDEMLIPILSESLGRFDNVTIIKGDILKADLSGLIGDGSGKKRVKVVANLPYYITTPIIMKLLESRAPLSSITVMVQKEVADRIRSGPGSKAYGSLSLAVQYYAEAKLLMEVPNSCFLPRPNVDSAVIRLDLYENPPIKAANEAFLFRIIRAAFEQRRKTLSNALKNAAGLSLSREEVQAALTELGKKETARGEELSLSEFAELSNLLLK